MLRRLRRTLLLAALGSFAAALIAPPALAASAYPQRPIRLIVPFPAGGTVDFAARLVAGRLGAELGGQVIVDNLPGAGGVIATGRAAKSPADGYTLLFTTPNHTINPALFTKLPFDTEKDFVPISLVMQIPELLVAHSAQPYNDFKGFVAYAKAHPGQLNYGSAGNGTLPHVTMELLLQRLGVVVTHVPYKGAAPAMNDLLAGQVAIKMDTIATSAQQIRSGRLKALAIASPQRSPLMPDVPAIAELGLPGYQGILWMGILAPAGTDAAVVRRLHEAIARFAKQDDYLKQLKAYGIESVASDPDAFGRLIHTELGQWAEVVHKSNIKAE
ncbi:Argininosuccinate lyase (plasmid) [Variovorax sp. SRS16]|uniref:tripartite tricarboxylate transporter substrate binding protein n=1 Tax=Variovorax sp. SRS16 TaxID=282217 RepID=UPI001315D2F0|nr:tripartite tricarboxylate transporter substrate binding protein [Variovorax sp. SRS16]VTU46317.1 Argininosuccinate lyase [Variovorax sp. SRS16]